MAAAREELRADHLGDVGRWLETAIVADDQHRLSTDALWEAALKTTGEQPGTDKAWGVGRRQIVDLVKQLHPKLPALKKMRVDGEVRYGWEHWRLATAEEAEEAARPEPVQSGLAADISNSDGDSIRLVAGTDADPVFELREGWTARELIEQFRAREWHAPKVIEATMQHAFQALELGDLKDLTQPRYECERCGRTMLTEGICAECSRAEGELLESEAYLCTVCGERGTDRPEGRCDDCAAEGATRR